MPKIKAENTNNEIAVIDVNGTQLLVEVGKEYELNKLPEAKGDTLVCEKVLLYVNGSDVKVGKPYVKGAKADLEVVAQKKADKINVFKYAAKSRYRRTYGSRAQITRVLVKKIQIA